MDTRLELAILVHRYADAVSRRDIEQWAACWAEEASWTLRADRTVVGRVAIVALFHSVLNRLVIAVQNVLNGEVHIEPDGESATGRWYIIEHLLAIDGETGMVLAYYDDSYVLRDGRWLFTNRVLVCSYHGPTDLSGWHQPRP